MAAAAVTTTTTTAVATSATSLPVVGTILDSLTDRVIRAVQDSIQSAQNAGLQMETMAGQQVIIAIQNAKEAYSEQLDKTVESVGQAVTARLDQLGNMVDILENNLVDKLGEVERDAQQFANTLPFASKQPQLTAIHPQYVAITSQADHVLIKFQGNFPWSSQPNYTPSLSIGEQACSLAQNTTQEFEFRVPKGAFPQATANKCSFVMGQLVVPWKNVGWFSSSDETARYSVGIAVLPLSPGRITAHYSSSDLEKVTNVTESPSYSFDGNLYYPNRWETITFRVPPQQGWKVDTSVQPQIVMERAHGTHTQKIEAYDESGIQVTVGLKCDKGHTMGQISFKVSFTEYQMRPKEHDRTEDVALSWGDSKLLEPHLGEKIWKIAFDAFNGQKSEFGPADTGNDYLQIKNEGRTIRLIATPPNHF